MRILLGARKRDLTVLTAAQLAELATQPMTSALYIAAVPAHYRFVGGSIAADERAVLTGIFGELGNKAAQVPCERVVEAMRDAGTGAKTPVDVPSIVKLADRSLDNRLDAAEFCVCAHLVAMARAGGSVPRVLGDALILSATLAPAKAAAASDKGASVGCVDGDDDNHAHTRTQPKPSLRSSAHHAARLTARQQQAQRLQVRRQQVNKRVAATAPTTTTLSRPTSQHLLRHRRLLLQPSQQLVRPHRRRRRRRRAHRQRRVWRQHRHRQRQQRHYKRCA
jgi:hypothetical protein